MLISIQEVCSVQNVAQSQEVSMSDQRHPSGLLSDEDPISKLSNLDFYALRSFLWGGPVPNILTLGRLCRAGCLKPEPWNGYPAMPGVKEAVKVLATARRKGLA